jgi:ribosomal-protein-alanine N-acetyltransferase
MPSLIELRPITKELLPQIQAIDTAGLGNFWSLSHYEQEIDSPYSHLLGAISTELILLGFGCVWRVAEEAHLTILVVHPQFQGQGIGKYLVWGLLDRACQTGAEWMVLEVRESNHIALNLYQYFGFEQVGKRPNYYQDTGSAALILWCKGLQQPAFRGRLQRWQEEIHQKLAKYHWQAL